MFDDMQPYIFRTADGGKSWKKITAGLPPYAFVWVVREDLKNPDLLYAGTETGLFASFDAGARWVPFGLKNLPDVAVRDIFLQPRDNDILLATHGRGLYILDDATPVQKFTSIASHAALLLPIRPALRYATRATRSGGGDTEFAAPNPPYGAILDYYLREPVKEVRIEVLDSAGKAIRTIAGPQAPGGAGLHRVAWDLHTSAVGGDGEGGGRRGRGGRGAQVLPGVYTVRLTAGSAVEEQKVEVNLDPDLKVSMDDLQKQWDALQNLSTMIREVGDLLRQTDRQSDSPEWQNFRARLARPRGLSGSETGPRLSEQLQSLFNLIDGPNDAPTPAMMKLLAELEDEYRQVAADFQRMKQ
jgi:hypothetical protein